MCCSLPRAAPRSNPRPPGRPPPSGSWSFGPLLGTPFGPLVSALPADAQQQLRAGFASKLGTSANGVTVRTVSNVACGIK